MPDKSNKECTFGLDYSGQTSPSVSCTEVEVHFKRAFANGNDNEDAQLDFSSNFIQLFSIKGFYRSFKNKDFTDSTPMRSYDLKQVNPISPTYKNRIKE